jgi:CheY-like chemotaxis protein
MEFPGTSTNQIVPNELVMKVLIVNDDLMCISCMAVTLQRKFRIRPDNIKKAMNGLEAYEMATSSNFDLILMDLNMPVMCGMESTFKIKSFFDETNVFTGELIQDRNSKSPLQESSS